MIKKAWLLSQLRRRDEIPAIAAQIAGLAEGNGKLLWQLGKLYHHHNLQVEAIKQFERALPLVGDHPSLLYDLSIARFFSGDFAGAEHDLDRMLVVAPQAGPAMYLRAVLRRQGAQDNHVGHIEAQLKAGIDRAADEAAALYALAKELEDLGEHQKSFSALEAGARKLRSTLRYDISAVSASLQEIQTTFDIDSMSTPGEGWNEAGAIFIVGMPRTGTTLAERMLLQSGEVKAAGELMDFGSLLTAAMQQKLSKKPGLTPAQAALEIDFAALGREYMQGARQMAGGSPLFIDKLPANYMYCGMIRKALPNAKIIHLVRDPLDSCYAVFKTLFFSAYDFSYDLDELGEYYIAYHRTMRHWHAAMPGGILDVRYEDLVADTEVQARRIYDWCGLEWNADALGVPSEKSVFATASAAQVREPVHRRSVGSAHRHADKLAPLAAKLAAAGVIQS